MASYKLDINITWATAPSRPVHQSKISSGTQPFLLMPFSKHLCHPPFYSYQVKLLARSWRQDLAKSLYHVFLELINNECSPPPGCFWGDHFILRAHGIRFPTSVNCSSIETWKRKIGFLIRILWKRETKCVLSNSNFVFRIHSKTNGGMGHAFISRVNRSYIS